MRFLRFTAAIAVMSAFALIASAQSDGQKSFDKMKALAGTWEGRVTTNPADPEVEGKNMVVTIRVTSSGNAILHEMKMPTSSRPDNPITMLYLDSGRLMLTHYCDAGNRPRMMAKPSADGNSVEFNFVDVSGSLQYGHMHDTIFTVVDANHHTEDWTFMVGDKPVHAKLDLQRTK